MSDGRKAPFPLRVPLVNPYISHVYGSQSSLVTDSAFQLMMRAPYELRRS
jgi:hypothetical protein